MFDKDSTGELLDALEKACDGDFQTYGAKGGAYMREHFFGKSEYLTNLVADLSDDDIHI